MGSVDIVLPSRDSARIVNRIDLRCKDRYFSFIFQFLRGNLSKFHFFVNYIAHSVNIEFVKACIKVPIPMSSSALLRVAGEFFLINQSQGLWKHSFGIK